MGQGVMRARLAAAATAAVAVTAAFGIGAAVAQTDGEGTERTIEPAGAEPQPRTTIAENLDVQGILEVVPDSGDAQLRLTDPSGQIWEIQTDLDDFAVLDLTGGAFPFFIADGAPTNALTVGPDGNVGMGLFNPSDPVHVLDSNPRIRLDRAIPGSSGNQAWRIGVNAAGDLFILDDVNVQMRIFADGRIRYNPVEAAPSGANALGDLYNDTSGALCWFNGATWEKVVGPGTCS